MPSLHMLTSYDLLFPISHLFTYTALYWFFLIDFMSDDATFGVTGEVPNAIALEAELHGETPRQLGEWTPNDVF